MKPYNYAILKYNNESFQHVGVLLKNKYDPKKKYALIFKSSHNDGSESITNIIYSNDLEGLHTKAKGFISWYNYPIGIYKNLEGQINSLA